MIVQCSKCQGRYKVADEKIPPQGARIKCPRCQNIIHAVLPSRPAEPPSPETPVPAPPPPPEPEPPASPGETAFSGPPGLPPLPGLANEGSRGPGDTGKAAGPEDPLKSLLEATAHEPDSAPAHRPTPAPGARPAAPASPIKETTDSTVHEWGNIPLDHASSGPAPALHMSPPSPSGPHPGGDGKPLVYEAPTAPSEAPLSENQVKPSPRLSDGPRGEGSGLGWMWPILLIFLLGGGAYLAYPKVFPMVMEILHQGTPVAEGSFGIESIQASILKRQDGVVLATVRGRIINRFPSAKGMIRVKAAFKGADGTVLAEAEAYCGNLLSDEELAIMDMGKVSAAMQNELGQSLSNSSVPPRQGIPFLVVLENPPPQTQDVTVTVVSSGGPSAP